MSASPVLYNALKAAIANPSALTELLTQLYSAGAFTDLALTGTLSLNSGSDIVFAGTTGQNEIRLTDNLADALSIKIISGADLMVFKTTDSAESLTLLSVGTQKLGFFGTTPAVQASAYTQTYSTADKTVAAPTAATLTDNSGGAAADGTIGVVTAPTALTDSTGGSASSTLAAITTFTPSVAWNGSSVFPSAADATAIAAAITSEKNSIASLAARQAEDRTAIVALTDAIKELSAQVNKLIADDLDVRQAVTAVIDDLQVFGLVL